ncbi:MAG: DHH family phosphoesterase [Patescibacteria group bacterium]|nr:DHH family phosphoesterase [Patescibacteria group bacterium]
MNNQLNTLSRIKEIVDKGKTAVIVLPLKPSIDAIASATSLYLGLIKIGKNVSLACSDEIDVDLVGAEKFEKKISAQGKALMISFPYVEGSIDKIDYQIDGNYFNLVITPREGYPKLNPDHVKYSYTGGVVDFLIVIDAPNLNSIGDLYTKNQSQFIGKDIINIDRHLTNDYFGTVNLVDKTISSISELILKILQTLKVEIDRDMATNLYVGISTVTNNFTSYSTNANTFESVALLLRFGARKKILKKPEESSKSPISFNIPSGFYSFGRTINPSFSQTNQSTTQTQAPKMVTNSQNQQEKNNPKISPATDQNPSEMLKPKITRADVDLI